MKRLAFMTMAAAVAALAWTVTAFAVDPSVSGYGGQSGGVQSDVQSGGTLPFTGLDLALILGGGILLVLVGIGLRRLGRHRPAG